jgi:DNA polymerase-3 subunit chi
MAFGGITAGGVAAEQRLRAVLSVEPFPGGLGVADKVAEFIELRSRADKLPQVCVRTALHYEAGQTVAVYTPSEAEASELDDLLWTFRQNSFIPHVRLTAAVEPLIEPVVIFSSNPDDAMSDVLILASVDELPEWSSGFPHIYDFAEVYDEAHSQAGRRRYAALKAAGYRMRFVKL